MRPVPRNHSPVRRSRWRRILAGERGISLVEVIIALVLLEIVGASMVTLLTSSTAAVKIARYRTVAQQAALSQIEAIRAMDYKDVGVVAGNPAGCLGVTTPTTLCPNSSYPPSTKSISNGGLLGTLTTNVSYVSDPGPLSYSSFANYKKVVVTVRRTSNNTKLARDVTYIAPPVRPSQSNAVINARVVDYGNSTQVADVPVALSTGPSAPESDVTDSSGAVIFAGLTPNPTSGATAYYDLSLTPPTGYVTLYDTVSPAAPAHVQLSPGQNFPTALYIYQPATIYVDLRNFDGTAFTGTTPTVTVAYSRNSTNYSKNFTYPGSVLPVTSLTEGAKTVQTIPGLSYTVSVLNGSFYYKSAVTLTNSDSANVPDAYPNVLTHTFTFTNAQLATASVSVKRSGVACKNASVTITGGPFGGAPWNFTGTGTTSGTGAAATIANIPVGTSNYTIVGKSNVTGVSATLSSQTIPAGTTSFTVNLGSGSSTC